MNTENHTPEKSSPSALAKEALLALAKRKLAATPTNYTLMYQEIARGHGGNSMTAYEAILLLTARLQDRALAQSLQQASEEDDWRAIGLQLQEALQAAHNKAMADSDSNAVIGFGSWVEGFLTQLARHHNQIEPERKTHLLVLLQSALPVAEWLEKLQTWLHAWADQAPETRPAVQESSDTSPANAVRPSETWESRLAAHEEKKASREPVSIQSGLSDEMLAQRLCDLMQLLLINILEIVPEADIVKDQVEKIDSLLAGLLTMGRLDEVERSIRSMVVRGGIVRHGMEEAKEAIKASVVKLIERLSTMSNATEDYTEKLARHASIIANSVNMTALSYQIKDLLQDTEVLSEEMLKARSDLTVAQEHAGALEKRTRQLEQELAKLQKRVHTDPLTDMLDRRAMEEVYAEEIIRADRSGRALCLALIDINDLHKLAQQHGASLTQDALKYLLDVIKRMTRPSDSVARYGEHQMTILLVGAKRDDAIMVMTRLIRELTKSFFMRDEQHILLTFSCGVAQIEVQVGFSDALDRAETALRNALAQGKNLVLGG